MRCISYTLCEDIIKQKRLTLIERKKVRKIFGSWGQGNISTLLRKTIWSPRLTVHQATTLQLRPKVKTRSTCGLTTHLASVIAAQCEKRESEGRSSVKLWRAEDGKSKDLISASTFNVGFLSMTFKLLMVWIVHLLNNLTLPFIESGTGFVRAW